MFQPGLNELIVGKNAAITYRGLTVGNTIDFAGGHWKVVGVLMPAAPRSIRKSGATRKYSIKCCKRPANIFQSATVHLTRRPRSRNSRMR